MERKLYELILGVARIFVTLHHFLRLKDPTYSRTPSRLQQKNCKDIFFQNQNCHRRQHCQRVFCKRHLFDITQTELHELKCVP